MMNDIPWFEALAALGLMVMIVMVYELMVVGPLRRRVKQLADREDALERSLRHVGGMSARLVSAQPNIKQQLSHLGERLGQLELRGDGRSYEQAINLAERGERADRLVSCFGLAEAEATLVSLLHGDRNVHPNAPQGAADRERQPGDR